MQMEEVSVARIVKDSPEQVAFKLFLEVAKAEEVAGAKPDRKWILETYDECLRTVKKSPGIDGMVLSADGIEDLGLGDSGPWIS